MRNDFACEIAQNEMKFKRVGNNIERQPDKLFAVVNIRMWLGIFLVCVCVCLKLGKQHSRTQTSISKLFRCRKRFDTIDRINVSFCQLTKTKATNIKV